MYCTAGVMRVGACASIVSISEYAHVAGGAGARIRMTLLSPVESSGRTKQCALKSRGSVTALSALYALPAREGGGCTILIHTPHCTRMTPLMESLN